MNIYILDTSFKRLGVIDYCASIIWTRRYCAAGDFELYIPADQNALSLIKKARLVMRGDDQTNLMVIETIKLQTDVENGDYLTVSGRSAESWIGRRIVWSQTNLSGTVTNCVKTLLNNNLINPTNTARTINKIEIGQFCSCSETVTRQITGANLLETIVELLNTYRLGFELEFDGEMLYFNIYEGTDRSTDQTTNPHVIFSPEYDNLLTTEYEVSITDYKSVALVAGEGEGAARKRYQVGSDSGLHRRELYVDARDISSDTDDGTLEIDEYNALLAQKGNEALSETIITQAFSGAVEASLGYQYKKDYFLGDTVNIINEYGIGAAVRITEVIESWNENGYSCIPTFSSNET